MAKRIDRSQEDRQAVEALARARTAESRLVERARMVLGCWDGRAVSAVAKSLGVRPNTVIFWRDRFMADGMAGLSDRPRSGKPPRYAAAFRGRVLELLEPPPPTGQACWDGAAVARRLNASDDAVWRVLRREGVCLSRQRSWCVSTDPQFAPKAADIVGLYLNPPANALVVSVDEKPSIQALERAHGYVQTDSGKIVRGFKSTYKRHGTLNLFAALRVASGAIRTQITARQRRVEFLEFMDGLLAGRPLTRAVKGRPGEREIHVILDNYCIHKRNEAWLAAHPNVHFHFTPTSASWLTLVEVWFGILSRKALRGGNFKNIEELRRAIEAFIAAYTPQAKPFVWRKREVKGTQLRNTIVNLCN
jgi:transposase